MKTRRFYQCDVFTSEPTKGNPLAVVVDGDGLTEAQMQDFAAWTNLAETTFILKPTAPKADYRLKIYTPKKEMLFAGHPTLGSCAVWLASGGKPKQQSTVKQECGVGIVEISHEREMPAFIAPPTSIAPLAESTFHAISSALKINPGLVKRTALLNNGPEWKVLELQSAQDVLNVDSSLVRWPEFNAIGLIGKHPQGAGLDYEVRMLAPSSGMSEDPITGSLNSAIAIWMQKEGRLDSNLVISQGTQLGREGRVYITPDGANNGRILIGGQTQILIEGTVTI